MAPLTRTQATAAIQHVVMKIFLREETSPLFKALKQAGLDDVSDMSAMYKRSLFADCGNCYLQTQLIRKLESRTELKEAVTMYKKYNLDDAEAFASMESFNEYIGSWDMSSAKDMRVMFCNTRSFNQDISCWNSSNITCMSYMFDKATRSFNQDISSWNTLTVKDLTCTFRDAISFDADIASWNR
eukprot:scaffold1920_cov50-Attheya_sp.AAC.3